MINCQLLTNKLAYCDKEGKWYAKIFALPTLIYNRCEISQQISFLAFLLQTQFEYLHMFTLRVFSKNDLDLNMLRHVSLNSFKTFKSIYLASNFFEKALLDIFYHFLSEIIYFKGNKGNYVW